MHQELFYSEHFAEKYLERNRFFPIVCAFISSVISSDSSTCHSWWAAELGTESSSSSLGVAGNFFLESPRTLISYTLLFISEPSKNS